MTKEGDNATAAITERLAVILETMADNGKQWHHCPPLLPLFVAIARKYVIKQVVYKIIRLFSRNIKGVSYDNCLPSLYFYGT